MKRNGFTLIELLVVMALMGILFAVSFPSFRGYQDRSRMIDSFTEVKDEFEKAFSTSRSSPTTVSLEFDKNLNTKVKISESAIVAPATTPTTTDRFINLEPGVIIEKLEYKTGWNTPSASTTLMSDPLKVEYQPPYGDVFFYKKDPSGNWGLISPDPEFIEIELFNPAPFSGKFRLWKSALLETSLDTPAFTR